MRILKEYYNPNPDQLKELDKFHYEAFMVEGEVPCMLINGTKLPDNVCDIYFIQDKVYEEPDHEPITYIAAAYLTRDEYNNL